VATITFTQQLARFTSVPTFFTAAHTLEHALEDAFARNPQLAGYVLDDQRHLRKHVVVFIDGERLRDRTALGIALNEDSTVHVLQALSGG
jgi:sulfur-carrier protein